MKRLILFALALAACAPAAPPPAAEETTASPARTALVERLVGCWRWEDGGEQTYQEWKVDEIAPVRIMGESTVYTGGGGRGLENYTLAPEGEGHTLCYVTSLETSCWTVTTTEPRRADFALVGGEGDHLKIVIPTADGERTVLDGDRRPCT